MFPNVFTIVALNHHPQSAQHYLLLMYLHSNWSSCTWTLHGQQILHTPCYVYHNIVKSFTEQVHTRPATLSQIAVTSVLWINVTNKFLLCHQKELVTILQHSVSFSKQNLRLRILLCNEFITPTDTGMSARSHLTMSYFVVCQNFISWLFALYWWHFDACSWMGKMWKICLTCWQNA